MSNQNSKTNGNINSLQVSTPCADGCGANAATGSSYLPGHDAKLDSMLQRYADGELATLPELVAKNVAAGRGKPMPSPRWQRVELTVKVSVRVPFGIAAPVTEANTILHKRLNVRAVEVVGIKAESKDEVKDVVAKVAKAAKPKVAKSAPRARHTAASLAKAAKVGKNS